MYNRYQGNTGRFVRVPSPEPPPARPLGVPGPPSGLPARPTGARKPPPVMGGGLGSGLGSGLAKLLPVGDISEKLSGFLPKLIEELDTEDILLALVLYLMYRESGDKELLIILGAMLLP